MFEFNFNIFQRTSSFGYMMMEFMFISTRVAFGQYFMQRCVAMKTLPQGSAQFLYVSTVRRNLAVAPLSKNCLSLNKQEHHLQLDWF